jgi:hypothetical protein
MQDTSLAVPCLSPCTPAGTGKRIVCNVSSTSADSARLGQRQEKNDHTVYYTISLWSLCTRIRWFGTVNQSYRCQPEPQVLSFCCVVLLLLPLCAVLLLLTRIQAFHTGWGTSRYSDNPLCDESHRSKMSWLPLRLTSNK